MSGTAHGTDPSFARWTTQTGTRRHSQTVMARPARLPAQSHPADRPRPGEPWTDDPYAHALRTGRGPLFMRRLRPPVDRDDAGGEGELLPLDVERWCAAPDAATPVFCSVAPAPFSTSAAGPDDWWPP